MNKIAVVLVAAVAACVCADTFTPKKLPCSFSAEMNTSVMGMLLPGHMWGMQKGDAFYSRVDSTYGGQVMASTITRCDKKNDEGKCFEHSFLMGQCTDDYVDGVNEYDSPFEYVTKETVTCPVGDGDCTKYCNKDDETCIIANKDNAVIGIEVAAEQGTVLITLAWLDGEQFTTEQFALQTCNGTNMTAPASPCDDSSSQSYGSDSSVTPKSSSASSSMVKASFIAVLAALLLALF